MALNTSKATSGRVSSRKIGSIGLTRYRSSHDGVPLSNAGGTTKASRRCCTM